MSVLGVLARAEAVAAGRAVPAATVRHRHLAQRPVVLVMLTTAGEAGAPLGALVGADRERPDLLIVPQPLDRDLRFTFFADLARLLLPLLEEYADDVETEPATRHREETELCADAPQIVVPNAAALDYVRLLGRSTRFLRTAEDDPDTPYPVPVPVPLLGRWLTHYAERARTPGSALLVAATELLTRHWTTGQSALEDRHLGALLGWIDPPPGLDGPAAAARAETARGPDGLLLSPPAGPATDPVFDNRVLAPAMARYDAARAAGTGLPAAERRLRELIASQLRPAWDDVWHALDLLRTLPEGAHVDERWKRDRWSFTAHRDRVRAGEPPQPRRDDAVTAARKLAGREAAQARLFAQEALDDPLAMAGRRLAGEAFTGEVMAVEMTFSQGRRPMPRPVLTIATRDVPQAEPGTRLYRATDGTPQPADVLDLPPAAPQSAPDASRTPRTGPAAAGAGPRPGPDAAPATAAAPATHSPAPSRDEAPTALVPAPAAGHDAAPAPVPAPAPARDAEPAATTGPAPDAAPAPVPAPARPPGLGPRPPADVEPYLLVRVRLTGGMGNSRTPKEGSVPDVGETVTFTLFEHAPRGAPALPDPEATPWTHGGPPHQGGPPPVPEPDPVTAEDYL